MVSLFFKLFFLLFIFFEVVGSSASSSFFSDVVALPPFFHRYFIFSMYAYFIFLSMYASCPRYQTAFLLLFFGVPFITILFLLFLFPLFRVLCFVPWRISIHLSFLPVKV